MSKVVLYTKGHCPHCKRAKRLLSEKGVNKLIEVDLEVVPEKREEMIARSNGGTTVPQIFIGKHHVGGANDLFALDAAHNLDPLLQDCARP